MNRYRVFVNDSRTSRGILERVLADIDCSSELDFVAFVENARRYGVIAEQKVFYPPHAIVRIEVA